MRILVCNGPVNGDLQLCKDISLYTVITGTIEGVLPLNATDLAENSLECFCQQQRVDTLLASSIPATVQESLTAMGMECITSAEPQKEKMLAQYLNQWELAAPQAPAAAECLGDCSSCKTPCH